VGDCVQLLVVLLQQIRSVAGLASTTPLASPYQKYLVRPLADLAGGIQRAPCFHFAYQLYQFGSGDRFHRAGADTRNQIILQIQLGFGRGALCPAWSVLCKPLSNQRLKSQPLDLLSVFERFFLLAWVDPQSVAGGSHRASDDALSNVTAGYAPRANIFALPLKR
jgi:hypothetical protein